MMLDINSLFIVLCMIMLCFFISFIAALFDSKVPTKTGGIILGVSFFGFTMAAILMLDFYRGIAYGGIIGIG